MQGFLLKRNILTLGNKKAKMKTKISLTVLILLLFSGSVFIITHAALKDVRLPGVCLDTTCMRTTNHLVMLPDVQDTIIIKDEY